MVTFSWRSWLSRLACSLRGGARRRHAKARGGRGYRLRLEQFEDRIVPATLDINGALLTYTASAGIANSLTVTLNGANYEIAESAETITLTAAAQSAGWTGSGSNQVS